MKVISIRENPEYKNAAIEYLQQSWPEVSGAVYEDCLNHTVGAENPLPQWYLLENDGEIIGCAGLITNDFVSRMDLYPWLCALYIADEYRGHNYSKLLIERAKADTLAAGFRYLYLTTDHIGLYEKHGFEYMGQGFHPWEEQSRIYRIEV